MEIPLKPYREPPPPNMQPLMGGIGNSSAPAADNRMACPSNALPPTPSLGLVMHVLGAPAFPSLHGGRTRPTRQLTIAVCNFIRSHGIRLTFTWGQMTAGLSSPQSSLAV